MKKNVTLDVEFHKEDTGGLIKQQIDRLNDHIDNQHCLKTLLQIMNRSSAADPRFITLALHLGV